MIADDNPPKPGSRRSKPSTNASDKKSKPRTRIRVRFDEDRPYEGVGYGKPPRAHQFKPGQSGNPKGRAQGKKNEATMLDELLFKKIKVRDGGRERYLTLFEAMLRRFAEDSLKGNIKAASFLFSRYGATTSTESQHSELNDDDQAILKAYAQDLLNKTSEEGK